MKIDNNTTKIQNKFELKNQTKTGVSNTQKVQSFGAGGNLIVSTMDAVDRGGWLASFLIQDFLGMNIPRTMTGLHRNKDITGEYNYQEALEVMLREALSGPVIFSVPMFMLWGIKRAFGKSNDVPVEMIRAMGEKVATYAKGKDYNSINKQNLYNDFMKDILKNAGVADCNLEEMSSRFTQELMEYETLLKSKKSKGFFNRFSGKRVDGSHEDALADLNARFSSIVKQNAENVSADFSEAKLTTKDGLKGKAFTSFVVDMRNFVEDITENLSKKVGKEELNAEDIVKHINKFVDLRTGSRVLSNMSMMGGVIAMCSILPKIYQLSKTNPGLKGIETKEDMAQASDNNSKNNAKQVAFGGSVETLGKKVAGNSKLSKFLSEFEFDHYNLSFTAFVIASTLGLLVPRMATARDENEFKEVVFRDTISIFTVAAAARILHQVFAKICSNVSGFALSIKPELKSNSTFAKIMSYMRPIKGHKVLTSDQLHSKYTNIDTYKDGVAGFAKFVNEQGGDIKKMFNADKGAANLLENIYQESDKAKAVGFDKATNKDIIEALEDIVKKGKAKESLENLYQIFRDESNVFLKKAKKMNSSFNFASIFVVCPLLLGWLIPRINEELTKKRQFEKNNAIEQKTANNKQNENINTKRTETKVSAASAMPFSAKNFDAFKAFLK